MPLNKKKNKKKLETDIHVHILCYNIIFRDSSMLFRQVSDQIRRYVSVLMLPWSNKELCVLILNLSHTMKVFIALHKLILKHCAPKNKS